MKSLDSMCREILQIDDTVRLIDISNFLLKNKLKNLDFLFLINFNFAGKSKNFNFVKDYIYCSHEIMAFKKLKKNYLIFCKITKNLDILGYKKYITNDKELIRKMELNRYKKIEDSGFIKFSDKKNNIVFVKKDVKKMEKIYNSLNKSYY